MPLRKSLLRLSSTHLQCLSMSFQRVRNSPQPAVKALSGRGSRLDGVFMAAFRSEYGRLWPLGEARATNRQVHVDARSCVYVSGHSGPRVVDLRRPATFRRRKKRLRTWLHPGLGRPRSMSPDLRSSPGPLSMSEGLVIHTIDQRQASRGAGPRAKHIPQ